jgi:hypothetical protein
MPSPYKGRFAPLFFETLAALGFQPSPFETSLPFLRFLPILSQNLYGFLYCILLVFVAIGVGVSTLGCIQTHLAMNHRSVLLRRHSIYTHHPYLPHSDIPVLSLSENICHF